MTKRPRLPAAAAGLVLLMTGACSDSADQADSPQPTVAASATDAPPAATTADPSVPAPSGAQSSAPGDATLLLEQDADLGQEAPAWSFPVSVDGWTLAVQDQQGVHQLAKDGSEALFTSYQLRAAEPRDSDAEGSRAYLARFAASLEGSDEVAEVGDPAYSTRVLGEAWPVEFAQQDLTYRTASGTYRSRFLARALGDYVLSVQYAAPQGEWSEEEWEALVAGGLAPIRS